MAGLAGCSGSENTTPEGESTGTDDETDTDSQMDSDTDGGTDTESQSDSDTDSDTDGAIAPEQVAKLAADDGGSVGAVALADGSTALTGAGYIFTQDEGSWTQQTRVAPDGLQDDDSFGMSVALTDDGTKAFVGRPSGEVDAGEVYIYSQDGGSWTHQTTLTPDAETTGQRLGHAIGLTDDGSTALISATGDESNGSGAGAVYVFSDEGGSWSQQATLTADDGDEKDDFGTTVAVTGDTAIIGAEQDEDPNGKRAGSAYVFSRDGGSWSQQAKLSADDGVNYDSFGKAVALADDGTTALVGSQHDESGDFVGSVYAFSAEGGSWSQQAKLTPDSADGEDLFGSSVSLAGGVGLIGASGDQDPNGDGGGSAYVFTQEGGSWTQQAKFSAGDGDSEDEFGRTNTLSDDGRTALVGAPDDEDPNGEEAGSAYVFTI